jgi:hypothetical protein
MLVEIELVGQTNNWSYRKARILIGRDSRCDVSLTEYSMVSREHVMLELREDGELELSDRSANGTFLNGKRVGAGIVHSGDTLRLGADGPELRFRLTEEPSKTPATPGYAETIVRRPESEVTSVANESAATVIAESPTADQTVLRYAESIAGKPEDASAKPVRVVLGEAPKPEMPRGISMQSPARPIGPEVGDQQVMDKKLDSIRNLLAANLAVMVILLLAVLYQGQQINRNKEAITGLREEAQNAVKTFTPALDQRLKTMEQRMDGFDGKMKQAEDRFVERMNKELPSVMDKYINRKFEEMKRQVGR